MTLRVDVYAPKGRSEWDDFVRRSRNGTFLFLRNYMDYHADRFKDSSLVVRDAKGHVRCLLPANREGEYLVSHGGLTYGGFVTGASMRVALMLEVFDAVREWLAAGGIEEWIYKPVPHIYHLQPAEEDLYALFRCGAVLVRRDVGACACPAAAGKMRTDRMAAVRKAEGEGLTVEESAAFGDFWRVLEESLLARYGAHPVHSLAEIELLKSHFPNHIRLFVTRRAGAVEAGAVVYETEPVARVQYSAATEWGMKAGAPSLMLAELLRTRFRDKRWLDYGTSTREGGRVLNASLQEFKEGLGLRSVVADSYRVPLA